VKSGKSERKKMISQRWDPELLGRVKEAAGELGQSVSMFTERALEAYFAEVDAQRLAAQEQLAKAQVRKPRKQGGGKGNGAA
jgi:predicted transcriptional regulator